MVDYNYGNFNKSDPGQWKQFEQQGAAATTGINAMPYVLGGAVPYTWLGGQDRTVPEIKSWLYPGAAGGGGGGGGGGGINPTTLQQLLGLLGGGATAAMLGGGAPADTAGLRGGGPA